MRIALALVLVLAAAAPEIRPAAIHTALESSVGPSGVPLAVVVVTAPDRVLYRGSMGASEDAIFRIFSMTKPVTSVAVMMLVEEGKIRLDDPVAKYLPSFVDRPVVTRVDESTGAIVTGPARTPVTIRHLLTNTSGIGYPFSNRTSQLLGKANAGKSDIELPLVHEPGTRWTYGPSTRALGDIVEKLSGMGLEAFMTTRIFEPLGMKDTSFTLPPEKIRRLVNTFTRNNGKNVSAPNPEKVPPTVRGDYGLFSTGEDYAAFLRMLLNGGGKLLKPETVRAMTSNQIGAVKLEPQASLQPSLSLAFPAVRGDDKFGLGFHIEMPAKPAPGRRAAGSYGWSGVMNTHFWVDPVNRLGVVVLTQLTPFYDPTVVKLLDAVETAIYPSTR